MDRESARQQIRSSWRQILDGMTGRARQNVNGEPTYICPICGNGEGSSGDGLTFNPKSKDRNGLKCFKCGFSGDIIDLYQRHTGADYNTALTALADELYITIDPYRPEPATAAADFAPDKEERPATAPKTAQEGPQAFQGMNAPIAAQKPQEGPQNAAGQAPSYIEYYKACRERLSDPAAQEYLSLRGISQETAAAYWIGYDPAWRSPKAVTEGKNPPYSPRLIIPTSESHYIARDTRPGVKNFAKMNEGSPAIFNRRALYAPEAQEVFIVEGALDALSIIEAGSTAIALNSTSNVRSLLQELEQIRPTATLILCLDNDDSGKKAAQELKEGLQRLNIAHIAADICGACKDPNEALTTDKRAFIEAIEVAKRQAGEKPDNVKYYIESLMGQDMARFNDDINTGFSNLDALAGGLYSGLYTIAAISSLGKTTFAAQLADQIAAGGPGGAGAHDVLFFSMEQSRLELVSKSIARRTAQIDMGRAVTSLSIRKGYLPEIVQQAAKEYKEAVQDRLSIIEGNFNCTISFIGDYVKQFMRRNPGARPVIVIDYLQILQPETTSTGRQQTTKEAMDAAVTQLKRISRDLEITIIVISSINRANYLQPVDFESLKESGAIEYGSDVIWGLQLQCLNEPIFEKDRNIKEKRDRVKQAKASNPRKIELVCLKNRYGISNYSCYFDYYPANDLFTVSSGAKLDFIPENAEPAQTKMERI